MLRQTLPAKIPGRAVRANRRADPGVLRRGPDRARLPRGRRPPGLRPLPRGRGRRMGSTALCYFGANIVPSGSGCEAFAGETAARGARMIIGQERAVRRPLGGSAASSCRIRARIDPVNPSTSLEEPPASGSSGLRVATPDDLDLLLPACAATHHEELGRRSARARRGRVSPANDRPDRGGPVLALGRGRDDPLQGGGLGVDADGRSAPASLGRPAGAAAGPWQARAHRPLPAPARGDADGVPVRPPGERGRDPPLREDRHAPSRHLPERPLLQPHIRMDLR